MANYRAAWDEAIGEYNGFGLAKSSAQHRVDGSTSLLMFGFKVGGRIWGVYLLICAVQGVELG